MFEAIAIGVSAGGMNALKRILPALPESFALPIIVVQHQHPSCGDYISHSLDDLCKLKVKQADEKEFVTSGVVYFAPPDYHLLIGLDRTFSLST